VALKTEPEACRWKGCAEPAKPDAWFCADHAALAATRPPGSEKFAWASNLTYVVSTGLATNAVYDVLKALAEHRHLIGFSDPLQEKIEVILETPKLKSVDPVQHYVELSTDPNFVTALNALNASAGPHAGGRDGSGL
jgi:hypothetical protein